MGTKTIPTSTDTARQAVDVASGKQALMQRRLVMDHETVVSGLHEIAVDADANASARLQAWTAIGKRLDMIQNRLRVDS